MPDQTPATKRGWCPFCLREITLTKSGHLRHHGGPKGSAGHGWGSNRLYRCHGAGKLPRTNPREAGDHA